MFKKGKKRSLQAKKKQFRRTGTFDRNDNDTKKGLNEGTAQEGENEQEEESSTMKTILNTKKRRMLLQNLEQSKGISTTALLQATSKGKDENSTPNIEISTVDTTKMDQLDMNKFGAGVHGEDGGNDDDVTNSAMGAKHKEAMEMYIRNKQSKSLQQPSQLGNASQSTNKNSGTNPNFDETLNDSLTIAAKEGDVGAGGAMLGGTGIAEVILPIDHRLKNIQETAEAAQAKEKLYQKRFRRSENNNESFKQGTIRSASSAGKNVLPSDVSNVGASYSHNFQLHTQDWIQKKMQEKEVEKKQMEDKSNAQQLDNDANQERIGFEALRRAKNGSIENGNGAGRIKGTDASKDNNGKAQFNHRSTDDRVWGNFVKNQRNRGRL